MEAAAPEPDDVALPREFNVFMGQISTFLHRVAPIVAEAGLPNAFNMLMGQPVTKVTAAEQADVSRKRKADDLQSKRPEKKARAEKYLVKDTRTMRWPLTRRDKIQLMADEHFPRLLKLPPVTWVGRKYMGGIDLHKDVYYTVRVGKRYYGTFAFSKYGSKEAAYTAAEKHWHAVCIINNFTRNEYGNFFDEKAGERVGIVKLTRNQVLIYSLQHERFVLDHTWYAMLAKGERNYMATTKSPDGKTIYFHRLVYPDSEVVDHINGDALDCRLVNIRPVTQSINQRNMRRSTANTSGVIGVSRNETPEYIFWVAHIPNGKPKTRHFSVAQYGENGAREEAIAARLTAAPGGVINSASTLPDGVQRLIRKPRVYWSARWRDNDGHNVVKTYDVALYGEETARELAVTARCEAEKQYGYMCSVPRTSVNIQ